ncbi:hypothetical protein AAG570_003207 [Ranatra chinensis]|uniref:Uncharacterized protein n=1 Tax=Ranatra chinensis TaxID=642074 RepID=A0ABD0Y653_9HEMI
MASKRRNMFHKNKTQETTENADQITRQGVPLIFQNGPAKIILRKVGECDDRGTNEIRITGTKLGKLGRDTYSYSTDIILLQTVTDEIHSVFNLAYFGNGGWKKNWMVNDLGGVCASFKLYVPQAANYVFKKLNITSCPIAAIILFLYQAKVTHEELSAAGVIALNKGIFGSGIMLFITYMIALVQLTPQVDQLLEHLKNGTVLESFKR